MGHKSWGENGNPQTKNLNGATVHSILISNISSGSFENSFKEQPFPSSTIVSYKS